MAVQPEEGRKSAGGRPLLARMSHELRTPLNAIIGFSQLLEMGELTDAQRRSVQHIARAGRTLLELVDEALEISRLDAGELTISVEPVDVVSIIRAALDLIRPLAAERNVALVASSTDEFSGLVLADEQRLKHVILNLLSNAVKYNEQGGHVEVSLGESTEGTVRISVTDTGPGIPHEAARLFEPFERLGAEQRGIEGSGLGLTLAKGLTEAMGGRIGFESAPGAGATFWIELERASAPAGGRTRRGSVAPPRGSGAERTVLYIEDNLMNIELVAELLSSRPEIALITAIQGRLGIELARLHRPDLIFLDLNLPDVGGEEVLAQLKADDETHDLPVVVLSSDAFPAQVERVRAAGAAAYLTKPLDLAAFLELLDTVLT